MSGDKENAFVPHPAKFITGIRNCKYLVDQCNHQYTFNKDGVMGAKFYACTKKCEGCLDKVTVRDGMIVGMTPHGHESNPVKIDVLRKTEAMLHSIQSNPNIKTDTVVTNFLKSTLKIEERSAVGSKKSLERRIQRVKASILHRPMMPKTLDDLETIPESHSTTSDGERFLLCNFVNNGKRNIAFASRRGIEMLRRAYSVGGDGTFDIPPEQFFQVYLLLAELDRVSYPVVYAILGDKKSSTYKLLFQAIRQAMLRPLPEDTPLPNPPGSFNVDFEVGCINQFKSVFPEIKEIRGCLVHLKRNMTKKRQELGLSTWYQKSALFHTFINCLYNLTYVPEELVTTYYEALNNEMLEEVCAGINTYVAQENEFDEKGKPFVLDTDTKYELTQNVNAYLQYIEDNYVGGRTRTGYSSPRFPLSIWNHHKTALEMGQTTTNRNEGRNMLLRAAIPINAGVWQVIEGFQDLEAKTRAVRDEDIARLPVGGRQLDQATGDIVGPATQRKRSQSMKAYALKNIVEHCQEYSHVDYLKRLSNF